MLPDVGVVLIGSANEFLRLTPDDSDLIIDTVAAELQSNGLNASRIIVNPYSTGFADLSAFFEQLAQDWRGWDDVRRWTSAESDLAIEARHEYGHVHLRVTLRAYGPGWGNDGWTATADVTIDPGEQLPQIAADLTNLTQRT
jgi:Family of unknown function (DUF6228)